MNDSRDTLYEQAEKLKEESKRTRFYSKINGLVMNKTQKYVAHLKEDVHTLKLEREPLNPHDPYAVKVNLVTPKGDIKLGYIPKDTAASLSKEMDAGKKVSVVEFTVTGDREKEKVGVNVLLEVEK